MAETPAPTALPDSPKALKRRVRSGTTTLSIEAAIEVGVRLLVDPTIVRGGVDADGLRAALREAHATLDAYPSSAFDRTPHACGTTG